MLIDTITQTATATASSLALMLNPNPDLSDDNKPGETNAPTDHAAVAEQGAHLVRAGAGRDVEVLGRTAQEQVTHTTTDKVGSVAVARQSLENLDRVGINALCDDESAVDIRCRDRGRSGQGPGLSPTPVAAWLGRFEFS